MKLGGWGGTAHKRHARGGNDNDKVRKKYLKLSTTKVTTIIPHSRVSGGETIGQDTDGDGSYSWLRIPFCYEISPNKTKQGYQTFP